MTKEKFNEQCRIQSQNMWDILGIYGGRTYDSHWLRSMAFDFKLLAKNIEDLCDVYEMENK